MSDKAAISSPSEPAILQVLPRLQSGGVERGTLEIVEAIAAAGMRPIVASAGGALAPMVGRLKGEHITLPLHSKNPWTIWRNIGRLKRLIREKDIRIIHARSRAPAWSAYFAAKQTGIAFTATFHGIYGHKGRWKKRYNAVMLKAARIIAVSEFVQQHIVKTYGIDNRKIICINRGVDFRRFSTEAIMPERLSQLSREWRLADDAKNIILVPGRITRIKGQNVVLDALAKLQLRDFICVLLGNAAGHEHYVKELQEQIDKNGLEGKVRIVPATNYMAEAYALSDVVLMPSLKPEAFGRVAVEAQAMGKTVIASAHGGALETILPNVTSYLVEVGNADMLAQAIDYCLTRAPEEVSTMQQKAIHHVRSKYSITRMKQATIRLYQELLDSEQKSAIADTDAAIHASDSADTQGSAALSAPNDSNLPPNADEIPLDEGGNLSASSTSSSPTSKDAASHADSSKEMRLHA